MPPRPLLVARAPRRLSSGDLVHDRASVGVLRVLGAAPPGEIRPAEVDGLLHWLVVAVVASLPLDGGPGAELGPAPRVAPTDLVPWRPTTDLVLRGSTDPGAVTVRAGAHERRFATASAHGRSDLREGLVTAEGVAMAPVTATPPEEVTGGRWFDPSDVERFQAAPPPLRLPALRGDELVVVKTPGGGAELALPGMVPRLRVVSAVPEMPDQELVAFLDEVLIDLDHGVARVVYRALVPITRGDARDVDRIDVLFSAIDDPAALNQPFFDHDVPRATFEHAWELPHAECGEPPPPLSAQALQIARYETWDGQSPLPVLPLHRAAAVAAELAEQREPRALVLARHGLDGYGWDLEERAWAEAMAAAPADDDDVTLAHLWGSEFEKAQDELARPEEAARTPADYARITVALESSQPDEALRGQGIGLGAYQRLDRRVQGRAAAEPGFATELGQLMDAERATPRERRAGAPLAGMDSEDGGEA